MISLLQSDDANVRNDAAFAAAAIGKNRCLAALAEELQKGGASAAVMARGRFWSQSFLEQELERLKVLLKQQDLSDPRNQNTEEMKFSPNHH